MQTLLSTQSSSSQPRSRRTTSPALSALVGVFAVWAPVLAVLAAGLSPLRSAAFVAAAWAAEWLVAYLAGAPRGSSPSA